MTVYHAFVNREKARAWGFDVDARLCDLAWMGPHALHQALGGDIEAYALFLPPSRGVPASENYDRFLSDPAYHLFVISGN